MNSPDAGPCAVIEPRCLLLKQAIFFSEHPGAPRRDYPDAEDEVRVLRKMSRVFAAAEREQPLEWQAYRARLRKLRAAGCARAWPASPQ